MQEEEEIRRGEEGKEDREAKEIMQNDKRISGGMTKEEIFT